LPRPELLDEPEPTLSLETRETPREEPLEESSSQKDYLSEGYFSPIPRNTLPFTPDLTPIAPEGLFRLSTPVPPERSSFGRNLQEELDRMRQQVSEDAIRFKQLEGTVGQLVESSLRNQQLMVRAMEVATSHDLMLSRKASQHRRRRSLG
jgi:hypothetical protein